MEEKVKKEIETLRMMVLRWKRNYLQWASPEGGDEFLVEEFSEEISRHVSPLVRRLYECHHLIQIEAKEFLEFCYFQVEDLRCALTDGGET